MALTEVCTSAFDSFMFNSMAPLAFAASVAAAMVIAFNFMIGRVLNNIKMLEWSKTELLQLFVSVGTLLITLSLIQSYCAIDMKEIHTIFGINSAKATSGSVFNAAKGYMAGAVKYSHNALTAVRYHLEGYTILSALSAFICDMRTGAIGWGCLFGYSGTQAVPLGNYGSVMSSLNLFYNSALLSFFTSMNFLFILMYVQKGMVLFLLPFGVFLRSVPYLRGVGSLFMSVALAFLFVFPLTLAIFDMMGDTLLDRSNGYKPTDVPSKYLDESVFPKNSGAGAAGHSAAGAVASWGKVGEYFEDIYYLDENDNKVNEVIAFAAKAFIAGTFFPSAAMLATIASATFLARIYGQEIDLSRLMQMV